MIGKLYKKHILTHDYFRKCLLALHIERKKTVFFSFFFGGGEEGGLLFSD